MIWRLLPDVRAGERRRFLFLLGLLGLLFLGLTVGLAGAEALLLARLGIRALPPTLMVASVATFTGSLAYAAWVARVRSDRLLMRILLGTALAAAAASPFAASGPPLLLPALYAVYSLGFFLALNQFWTYAGEWFDVLAARRLFPLLSVGASLGGVAGGLLALALQRPEAMLLAWALAFAAAAAIAHRNPGTAPAPARRGSEMLEGARFLRTSPLARWFAVAAVGMVVAMSLLQYLAASIFTAHYPQADRLAAFLGAFMAAANVVEMAMSLWGTPWLLRRLGVPGTTLVHPVATLAVLATLAASQGLFAGALAWMDRKTLQGSLAAPVRTLAYNALPDHLRGRVRAVLEGFVVYLAAAGTTGALSVLPVEPRGVCAAGALAAGVYLVGALGVRREYLRALADEVSRGRLDLAAGEAPATAWEARRDAVRALAASPDPLALARLATALADPAAPVREEAAHALRRAGDLSVVEPYLQSRSTRAVEAALTALSGHRATLQAELRERVRQAWRDEASLSLLPADGNLEERFLRCALRDRADRERRLAFHALAVLEDPEVVRGVRRCLAVSSQRARATALELLSNLGDRGTAELLVLLLEEGDPAERLPAARSLVALPGTVEEVLEDARGSADPWVRGALNRVTMERLLLLESTWPLGRLTLEEQEELESDCVEERFPPGAVVYAVGAPADRVYVVAEGEVEVRSPEGAHLHMVGPGRFLGELALDGGERSREARATGPARLLSLRPQALRAAMERTPELSLAMLRLLTSRIRDNDRRSADLQARRTTR